MSKEDVVKMCNQYEEFIRSHKPAGERQKDTSQCLHPHVANTPLPLDISHLDELLKGVDKNMALLKLSWAKNQELHSKIIEYAAKIVELQNLLAMDNH